MSLWRGDLKRPIWLLEPNDKNLLKYIRNENKLTVKSLSWPIQQQLYREMRNRVQIEDTSIPERIGEFNYFMKQVPGKNYPIYCRTRQDTTQIVVDQNQLELEHEFMHLGNIKVSPDARYVVYTLDTTEDERYTAYLRDIETGRTWTSPSLANVVSVEWGSTDSLVLYYTVPDGMNRPHQVYRHFIFEDGMPDELIFTENDDAFFVDLNRTKDQRFVTIGVNSKTTSEVYTLDANDPRGEPRLLKPRQEGVAYFVDHAIDGFYVVTNENDAANYKIFKASTDQSSWEVVVPESSETKIEDVDMFQNFLVLYERHGGLARIRIVNRHNPSDYRVVPLPSEHAIGTIHPGANKEFETDRVRFSISTSVVPEIVYDFDMKTGRLGMLRQTEIPSNDIVESDYLSQQVHVQADDGVQIPMTIIHHKEVKLDGSNPAIVYGYGAYGMNNETDYHLERLSLLERGWVIAMPHCRGGGELGLEWHNGGRQLNKMNTFFDFVACLHHLFQHQYTSPHRVALHGTSAGGMIMGYVANTYPELCRAMILRVPFVDVLTTMMDPTRPLTVHEYDEWGNPQDPKVLELMKRYSPCENIRTQAYPSMLVLGSLNDQRVDYSGVLKWHKLVKEHNTSSSADIFLSMSESDTHFGSGGKLDMLADAARDYAFLFKSIN